MKTPEKLKLLQQLSGLTQERLAQKLGVSFATLNSWINGKSQPRKTALARIDKLYVEVAGQQPISRDLLLTKKAILEGHRKKYKNLIKTLQDNPDIQEQMVLSLTYHSNRIEGSTLTENQTAAILFHNATFRNKNVIEHLEVKNHQAAWNDLLKALFEKKRLDEAFILRLHAILLNGIREDAGCYRNHPVRIVGAKFATANHLKVQSLMDDLTRDLAHFTPDTIGHTAKIHARFELIHPFADGNGRVGRLLAHAMLLRKNLAPAVIRQERKAAYIACLHQAQKQGDDSDLVEFFCDAVLEGFKIFARV